MNLHSSSPCVSIVTTVYDRVECLARCMRSVRRCGFTDLEHVIVADGSPIKAMLAMQKLVSEARDPRGSCHRMRFFYRQERANDWGITPASNGLRYASGKYVCFLSDDNAYLPGHFEPLVAALDADPTLGFAYSSAHYAPHHGGKVVLNYKPNGCGSIDLGQPLFRRRVLREVFGDVLPFNTYAWDWLLIHALLEAKVAWQHVNVPSFVFNVAAYPEYVEVFA